MRMVLNNRWRNLCRRRHPVALGEERSADIQSNGVVELAEEEYRQHLVGRALQLLQNDFQPETWKAFWECQIQKRPVVNVTAELRLTVREVYLAKYRLLQRLREELAELPEQGGITSRFDISQFAIQTSNARLRTSRSATGRASMKYEAMMELLRSRLTYFMMLVLGLLGAAYFFYEDTMMRRISSNYKETTCVVESSEVVVSGRRKGGAPTSWKPQVNYAYAVAGKTYHGTVLRRGEQGMSRDEADEIAYLYHHGVKAPCFYDPEDPSQAVLVRESDERWLWYVFVFSLGLMGFGVLGWIVLEITSKPAQPPKPPAGPQPLEIPAWSSLSRLKQPGTQER
jgi:hypothetical protein